MKNNFLIILGVLICINSCRMPADPLGEIKIIKRLDTIDTGGNCLDLDVNMLDNILVAAANYNGFISYNIIDDTGELNPSEIFHGTDMAPDLGDDRIAKIILSEKYNFMVLFDQYDKIYLAKKDGTPIEYMGDGEFDCVGGAWHDVIIVDKDEEIIIFSLVNHQASEADADTEQNVEYIDYSKSLVWVAYDVNNNMIGQNTGDRCEYSININYLADDISYSNAGYIIVSYGELGVRIFKQLEQDMCYKKIASLSIGQNFDIYSLDSTITASSWSGKIISDTTGVLLTLELGNIPSEITNIELTDDIGTKFELEHDLLNGAGLGNRLWITDIGDNMYNVNFSLDSTINIQHYQFQLDVNIISIQKILYEPIDDFTSQQNYDLDSQHCEDPVWNGGKAGVFEPAGGLDPNIMTHFDTPGEVEVVYSAGNAIYAGLKYSNGCIVTRLDEDGTIINSQQFALGYSIKGIHEHNGLLALAAGNDGILLYNWNGGTDVSFIGKIETSYANNVKVADDIIFAATEDGIEVIQIDR